MRVTPWFVPLAVVVAAAAGVGGARLFTAPSYVRAYAAAAAHPGTGTRDPVTSHFVVAGLRCVDTARTMAGLLDEVPGVIRCECFASRNEARVTFDPGVTTPATLKEAIEGPVYDSTSFRFEYGLYRVLRMDGRDVANGAEG